MNRKEAAELLPIIQAFAEGRDIEYRTKGFNENWKKVTQIPELSFKSFEYRIKPEPSYRPFANAEECWQEMLKHQPFGWVKYNGYRVNVAAVMGTAVIFTNTKDRNFLFQQAFEECTFIDKQPFGIKGGE